MQILTKAIRDKPPKLYQTEHQGDPTVWVKFFYPDASWTWYGIEFDGDNLFLGLVDGHERDLGYFSLKELRENRPGAFKLPIERDVSFTPRTLSTLRNELAR